MQSYYFQYRAPDFSSALLFLLSLVLSFQCKPPNDSNTPNIIIINVDDMGWRDLGYTGSEFYESKYIDSLAAMGAVFTNGYASAANCAPSRACLMTGLWPPRHGIYTVGSSERGATEHRRLIPVQNVTTLNNEVPTLPEILKQQGYSTCHAGKWHLSDNPLERGFDHNFGGGHNGHPKSYFYPFGNVDLKAQPGDNLTDRIMDEVLDFVYQTEDPFFLYYSPYAVHTPIQPISSLKSKYETRPAWSGQSNSDYATMVENLDLNIGRLMKALVEVGAMDNTLVVFTSDNGGLYGITYQHPLRAGKGSYYEGGIRVPFFFVWKNQIKPHQNHTPITNLDLFPTLLEAAGVDLKSQNFDGTSLLSMLTEYSPIPERSLFWHFPIYLQAYNVNHNQNRDSLFRTRPGTVVRRGDWKLHHYFEDNGVELYNLAQDIGEQQNLALQNPEKRDELWEILENWRQLVNAPAPPSTNPEFIEIMSKTN